jgi:hypothetical protein
MKGSGTSSIGGKSTVSASKVATASKVAAASKVATAPSNAKTVAGYTQMAESMKGTGVTGLSGKTNSSSAKIATSTKTLSDGALAYQQRQQTAAATAKAKTVAGYTQMAESMKGGGLASNLGKLMAVSMNDAGAASAGYKMAGIDNKKFGVFSASKGNFGNGVWQNGSHLDVYRNIRSATGVPNGAYSNLVGNQGEWQSAKRIGGDVTFQPTIKIDKAINGTVKIGKIIPDYFSIDAASYVEAKVGSSFNAPQATAYAKSGQKIIYDFMSSPLSDAAKRQATNINKLKEIVIANPGANISVQQSVGPSTKTITAMKAVSTTNAVLRGIGKVAVPLGVAADSYMLYNAYQSDGGKIGLKTGKTAAEIGGSWTAAAAGATAGVETGMIIGTVVGGPVGTAVGAVVGGVVGAIGGAMAGGAIAGWLFDSASSLFGDDNAAAMNPKSTAGLAAPATTMIPSIQTTSSHGTSWFSSVY